MTKLTIESLEKFVSDIKADGMCDITDHQVESALIRLLAYEQAAKNPADLKTLVISEIVDFYAGFESPGEPETVDETQSQLIKRVENVFGLAAPVLPKKPDATLTNEGTKIIKAAEKLVRCKGRYHSEQNYRALAALFGVTIPDLPPLPSDEVPVQPVIPGQLTQRMAEEKALSLGAVLYDEEADAFADGWNACRAEMLKAQPVSEPYKLAKSPEACAWISDGEGLWLGDCGLTWTFFDDGPNENGLKYCPSCGKKVSFIAAPAQGSE